MAIKFNPLSSMGFDMTGTSSLSIGSPVGGADANSILTVDNSGNLADKVLTNGQLLIGSTSAAPVAATLTGTANQVNVTTGAGSITLSLPQSIHTAATPTFASLLVSPAGGIDTTGAGTLAIGTGNASIINIGNAGATVNVQGTTFYQNVTNLQVTDKLITLNKGGSAGSASNSGIEIEEGGSITGYVDTTADRLGWEFKAPAAAGIATINPGAGGITLNQSSHDPVTIGTANGLSLSTQQLSLGLSSGSTTGALSSTDWTTFNNKQNALTFGSISESTSSILTISNGTSSTVGPNVTIQVKQSGAGQDGYLSSTDWSTFNAKQPAGNYITALTGDGTASGPGSVALTLATVNSSPGSFGSASQSLSATVNGKGLITSLSAQSIQIAESQVTNLTTDLGNKVDKVTGDIVPTSFSGLVNNTANQVITGFSFANSVEMFDALVSIRITATANTYTSIKLQGINKSSNWTSSAINTEYIGDAITGLNFSIDTSGQVLIDVGNIAGFASATIKFRARVV